MIDNNIYIFLDIDGVLATNKEYNSNMSSWYVKYNTYPYNKKCVKVFNTIINVIKPIKPIIILSSDWGKKYNVHEMNEIFKWNNINYLISDVTPDLWKIRFNKLSDLEVCRATEILNYIKEHNVHKFIIIDDLDLSQWFETNFIHIKRPNEGIKQVGIKEKIINKIIEINKQ